MYSLYTIQYNSAKHHRNALVARYELSLPMMSLSQLPLCLMVPIQLLNTLYPQGLVRSLKISLDQEKHSK